MPSKGEALTHSSRNGILHLSGNIYYLSRFFLPPPRSLLNRSVRLKKTKTLSHTLMNYKVTVIFVVCFDWTTSASISLAISDEVIQRQNAFGWWAAHSKWLWFNIYRIWHCFFCLSFNNIRGNQIKIPSDSSRQIEIQLILVFHWAFKQTLVPVK